MGEKFFFIQEQDEDWTNVIKKFAEECVKEGLLYKDYRTFWGGHRECYVLSELAEHKGFTNPKQVFNYWYNKKRQEPVGEDNGEAKETN